MGRVLVETNKSIRAAVADKTLDPKISAGPIEVLRQLARRLDAVSDPGLDLEFRIVLAKDNVTLPTYLKACAELRLTPASRMTQEKPNASSNSKPASKLGKLQSVPRPA